MKNKILKTFLFFVLFTVLLITASFAVEIKEDVADYESDVYIIGSTRFDANQTITATMAANAGINEAKVQLTLGNDISKLKVTIYFYDAIFGDWYEINKDAKAELIEESTEIAKIEKDLNIFFVENEEKVLEVSYSGTVDEGSILSHEGNVTFENGIFKVPVLTHHFSFSSNDVLNNVETNIIESVLNGEDLVENVEIIPQWATMQVNGTYYDEENVEEALALLATEEEVEVKLFSNVTVDSKIEVKAKNAVLDLNWYTLTNACDDDIIAVNGTNSELTIKNGQIVCKGGSSVVVGEKNTYSGEKAVLNIENSVNILADTWGVYIVGNNTVANIAGTVQLTEGSEGIAVLGNGNLDADGKSLNGGTIINILEGAYIDAVEGIAIYQPQTGVTNIEDGAYVNGGTAVSIKSGTLNVNGGTLYANGYLSEENYAEDNNGSNVTGDTIYVELNKSYAGNVEINIADDATLYTRGKDFVKVYKASSDENIKITGRYSIISVNPSYPEQLTYNDNSVLEAAVKVGDKYFLDESTSINYALDLFEQGKETTLTLLKDLTLSDTIEVNTPNSVLDLGGNTLTSATDVYDIIAVNENGILTVKNGNIEFTEDTALAVYSKGTLNIESDATVKGGLFGVYVVGKDATANIAGTVTITDDGNAVLGNGSEGKGGTIINIESTAKILAPNGICIYQPQTSITTVKENAEISGQTAIAIKAGTLDIYSKNLKGGTSIDNSELKLDDNGCKATGDIIYVECHGSYADQVKINIHNEFVEDTDSNVIRVFKPVEVQNEVKEINGIYTKATLVEVKDAQENVTATVTTYTK